MKKIAIALTAALAMTPAVLSAQESASHFKAYGFIRNYAFVDTRATKSLSEDMFFFIPLDEKVVGGEDDFFAVELEAESAFLVQLPLCGIAVQIFR